MRWYEWDPAKAASNRAKHGVSFEVAVKVFEDPNALTVFDGVERGEERWRTVGDVGGRVLTFVAHTEQDDGGDQIVRIISARPATRKERMGYEDAIRSSHRR
jgi:uncharacterized DUF497 family protein